MPRTKNIPQAISLYQGTAVQRVTQQWRYTEPREGEFYCQTGSFQDFRHISLFCQTEMVSGQLDLISYHYFVCP